MSTLHERLLDEIPGPPSGGDYAAALRKVVELHHEFVSEYQPDVPSRLCDECDTSVPYPCPTITAIAEALGIGETPK